MSYADQKMSSGRITAIVIVAALHALLGYAFVTGLAYNVVKQVAQDLKTFDVTEEPPPPPEEPPPPPEEVPMEPPPVVSPPPIVRTNVVAPPIVRTVREAPPPVITPTAPPAPPPPPPPPPKPKQAAQPATVRSGSFSNEDDYPSAARRAEEEGTVRVRLSISASGRVESCTVTGSSGSSSLDSTTCRIFERRFRYRPAEDSNGNPVADTVTQSVRWVLED
jgi:periplasmic protein TonB